MAASQYLEPGSVFGPYEIDSMVGRGTNAVVYLARHTREGTWHALKLVSRVDSRKKIRLEQEAIFRDELRHPHIVPATETVEVEDQLALVSEFVEGPSLSVWMRDSEPPLSDLLALFRGVVEGVAHAHANQVIHRDLKPSNVLLQPGPGDTWIPRISDFGLAKALSPEVGKFGGLTTVNTGLGTPGYAAPEQSRDASAVTYRADLYSLGCILYEMVCGVAPFAGMSAFDVLAAQRDHRFTAPEDLAPGLPPDLYQLIRKLLSADPMRRPPDCETVMQQVDVLYHLVAVPEPRATEDEEVQEHAEPTVDLGRVLLLCAIPLLWLVIGSVFVLD